MQHDVDECRVPVDVLRNAVIGDYAAVDVGEGEGAATGLEGMWLLLSLQWRSNAIVSGSAIAMTPTITAAAALPTRDSALPLRTPSLLSRGFCCCCVVPPVVLSDDAAPGEEEKNDNETAVAVVCFDMRVVGAPMSMVMLVGTRWRW